MTTPKILAEESLSNLAFESVTDDRQTGQSYRVLLRLFQIMLDPKHQSHSVLICHDMKAAAYMRAAFQDLMESEFGRMNGSPGSIVVNTRRQLAFIPRGATIPNVVEFTSVRSARHGLRGKTITYLAVDNAVWWKYINDTSFRREYDEMRDGVYPVIASLGANIRPKPVKRKRSMWDMIGGWLDN